MASLPLKFIQARIETSKDNYGPEILPASELKCTCGYSYQIHEALDASKFYNAGATIFDCKIAFDCRVCHRRIYISLQRDAVEMGDLGASPVFDPIPGPRFAYPFGFSFSFAHENGTLHLAFNAQTWSIKEYGKH